MSIPDIKFSTWEQHACMCVYIKFSYLYLHASFTAKGLTYFPLFRDQTPNGESL